jgi:hypothetical protein
MKAVQLLIDSELPEDLRDPTRSYDSKSIGNLMRDIARKYPDRYEDLAKKLTDVGRLASYHQGETLTLDDLKPVLNKAAVLKQMDAEVAQAKKESSSQEDFENTRIGIWTHYSDMLEHSTQKAALAQGNNLAYSVASGARGKPPQLKAMLTTPGLFSDYRGNTIPLFVRHSFGEGLRPYEYLASTAGTRRAVISTKSATARGGDFGKIAVQAAAPIVITTKDCGVHNGIELPVDDSSLRGRVLARDTDGVKAGQVLDAHTIAALRNDKVKSVIARSSLTCQAKEGICAKCAGQWAGKFPDIGSSVGVTDAQAIGEPITQMALNEKHCLTSGTMVRMADYTTKSIESIQPGDWVLGSDGAGRTCPVRVVALYDRGVQQAYRYHFRFGATKRIFSIGSTDQHLALVNIKTTGQKSDAENGKLQVRKIGEKRGNFALIQPTEFIGDTGTPEPFALLLGLLLGDGCYTESVSTVNFTCHDPSLLKETAAYMAALNLKWSPNTNHGYYRPAQITQAPLTRNTLGQFDQLGPRNPALIKLHELGMWGRYAHEKTIPVAAYQWDNNSVANLIAGIFCTDGSICKAKQKNGKKMTTISFASASRTMLTQIRDLLAWRFCIYTSEITKTHSIGGSFKHDQWAFTITRDVEVKRFIASVPLHGVKRAKAKAWFIDTYFERADIFYRCKRQNSSTEDLGLQQTWDIEVDSPDNLFVLESGAIVHNSAGMASGKREFSGFDVISQFTASPETFPDRAAVAEHDGKVTSVEEAPQGGHYVKVNDTPHYVMPGYAVTAKAGDKVEAGDPLSDGLVDPGDVIRLRGLGEGRDYYVKRLQKILGDSGMPADRRNVEMLARAALNHVVVEDPEGVGDYLPDDVASYARISQTYTPPKSARTQNPTEAVGQYLHAPALHYTIGTRITPRIAEHLKKTGYDVVASEEEPGFRPEMTNLRTASQHAPGWLEKQHTSYLRQNLSDDAMRGRDTDIASNVHFAPRLAVGADFGNNIETTGKF